MTEQKKICPRCSGNGFIIGAAMYGGMEKKPNPLGAIKLLKKKDKNDE